MGGPVQSAVGIMQCEEVEQKEAEEKEQEEKEQKELKPMAEEKKGQKINYKEEKIKHGHDKKEQQLHEYKG